MNMHKNTVNLNVTLEIVGFIYESMEVLHFSNKINVFIPKAGATTIATPGLILCAMMMAVSLPIISDNVRKHMWRDFWQFLHAEPLRIIDIMSGVCTYGPPS